MRIVAGIYKGRNVKAPSGDATRPTTDRTRESMFSSLISRTELEGAWVLDAFAGSGALGIEALSRGAEHCTFFESNGKTRRVLQENLSALGIGRGQSTVVGSDVFAASARPLHSAAPFDVVLLDPPYAVEPAAVLELLAHMHANGDLAEGCVIAYEHAVKSTREAAAAVEESGLFELDGAQKKYGNVGVSYLTCVQG